MRTLIIIILSTFTSFVSAQDLSNLRTLTIPFGPDTTRLDSLAIVPGSIIILLHNQTLLPDSLYNFIPPSSVHLTLSQAQISQLKSQIPDSLTVIFRVFPFSVDHPRYHRSPNEARIDPMKPPFEPYKPGTFDQIFDPGGRLKSSGSLSRGISVGNNRDASLQSTLNLQLQGPLTGDFQIEASLSDANIPVQPDGTTQQIQEFDKVYMRIFNPQNEIIGGDFELISQSGAFLKMFKKVQGLQYSFHTLQPTTAKRELASTSSIAMVKGKYARNRIQGIEGNQGPYALTGSQGEQYIQVIAGSEKIYIDGKLLMRGENADYVMDYNVAEIRFTARNLITKDKRITAEFEYTERSYIRFMFHHETRVNTSTGSWYMQLFSESDARNQPLLQDLTPEQKALLSSVGDQLDQARSLNIQDVGFLTDRVLYKMIDTLVLGVRYDSVLVQSFNPDSAKYQAGFMLVGKENGNYIQVSSSANGRVFKWVAPQNGVLQGDYEPYTRLVTPKSKQVLVTGTEQRLGDRTQISAEWALTRNNLNTFSKLDSEDDIGMALQTRIQRNDTINRLNGLLLRSWIGHRYTGSRFNAVERFRPIEFERDWNLNGELNQTENLIQAGITAFGSDSLNAGYQFDLLNLSGNYMGYRHLTNGIAGSKKALLNWQGSYMTSSDPWRQTGFLRHSISYRQHLGKLTFELSENHEGNHQYLPKADSMLASSFAWQEFQFQLGQVLKDDWPWVIKARYRNDRLPKEGNLQSDSRAWEAESWINLTKKPTHQLKTGFHVRQLELPRQESEESGGLTLTGRFEDQWRFFKDQVRSQTFIEVGSGTERKIDYSYLEVAPGQGLYTWNDYNQNGVQELDEFDPAHFQDQASFIRIYRPGNVYIPTLISRFNQSLILKPSKGFLKKFSCRLAYRMEKKTGNDQYLKVINPIDWKTSDPEIITLQGQIRHTLSYNNPGSILGIDLISQKLTAKTLLVNGADVREGWSHSLMFRYRFLPAASLLSQLELGEKTFSSEYFKARNYNIGYQTGNIRMEILPDEKYRIGAEGEFRHEGDVEGGNELISMQLEASLMRQIPAKGQIELSAQYIRMNFEGISSSPAGYLMLSGFQPGNNMLLKATVRYRLAKNLQMDLSYEGRKPAVGAFVHNGQIQVRAIF